MKFLGWMHRKLTQNGTYPNKNSPIGNITTCFSEQNYCKEPTKALTGFNNKCQKSPTRSEGNNAGVDFHEESFDPFDFLSIGTFGMELLSRADPPTPTLTTPFEKLTNPSDITENDLKFISYELEKFIEAEEKEIPNDTSGRISEASIITLSHETSDGADYEDHMYTMDCPLQNYLFATSIEETKMAKEVKKENISVEGVDKMNSIAHDDPAKICEGEEQKPRKRNVTHFMKKVVKNFHSSSSCSKASSKDDDAALSILIKKKLSKAVKMFHKKVHPQEMTETQFLKIQKGKKDISHEDAHQIRGYNGNNMVNQSSSKMSEKSTGKLSSNGTYTGASTISEGHWIKTDSDYLVLEL